MRSTFLLVALGLLVFSLLTLVYITQQGNEQTLTNVGDTSFAVLALFAMVGSWCAYTKIPKEFVCERRGWLCITIALIFFMLGDIYWGYAEIVSKVEVPIGSIADWAWQVAYFMLFCSVINMLSIMWQSRRQIWSIMGPTFVIAAAFTIHHLYIDFVADHIVTKGFIHLVQDSYVLYDIILLGTILVMLVPLAQSHNRLMNNCLLFGLAFTARIVFDFLFAGLTATGQYSTGNFIDLFYAGSYLLLIFAADAKTKMLQHKIYATTAMRAK